MAVHVQVDEKARIVIDFWQSEKGQKREFLTVRRFYLKQDKWLPDPKNGVYFTVENWQALIPKLREMIYYKTAPPGLLHLNPTKSGRLLRIRGEARRTIFEEGMTMKVLLTKRQVEATPMALDNHLMGDKQDRLALWLTKGMVQAARNARGILSLLVKKERKKMKEDELIGKLVKDYRLNDDALLVCVILEDGTEIRPQMSRGGEYYLETE